MFSYISEGCGYEDNSYLWNIVRYKLDFTLNGTNSQRNIHQSLFQYYYFMKEMGYSWEEVIKAVKRYARSQISIQSYSKLIQNCIPYNEENHRDHGWYVEITAFTKDQLKLPTLDFIDVLIDYIFNIEHIRAYPSENGVSIYEDKSKNYYAWLDINIKNFRN